MRLFDFKRAVNTLVSSALDGLEIPIVDADLTEPIVRPSIKTFVDGGTAGRENSCIAVRTITTDIYFFAADRRRPRLENMEVADRLAAAFLHGIDPDAETHLELLEDVEFTTEDGVLHCTFDIESYLSVYANADGEQMETLSTQILED